MSSTPTPVKVRSMSDEGGLYEVVGTNLTIERCSWDNASTGGINSRRPLWVIVRHDGTPYGATVSQHKSLRDAKVAAASLI